MSKVDQRSKVVNQIASVLAVAMAAKSVSAATATETGVISIAPGDVFVVVNGGVEEYSSSLQLLGTLTVPGVTTTEGVALTPQKTLVFYGAENAATGQALHVFNLAANGTILHDLNVGGGSIYRGSEATFDSSGRYTAAFGQNVLQVSSDFTSFQLSAQPFNRAAGVAFGPDGTLYASDANDNLVRVLNPNLAQTATVSIANYPAGVAFAPNGQLAVPLFNSQAIDEINLTTGSTSVLSTQFASAEDIAFNPDGSYYVSYGYGRDLAYVSAGGVTLDTALTGDFSDSIVVVPTPVPEPATATAIGLAGLTILSRRRRAADGNRGGGRPLGGR